MKCDRCGKENPAEIHTCTPLALTLASLFERYAIDHKPSGWPAIRQIELNHAASELRRLYEANDDLLGTLKHARDLVAEWGVRASAYEQEKYGLYLDLKQLDAVIRRRTKT